MKQNKLLLILQSLSTKERKSLSLFVRSPIHNKNEAIIDLYDYLNKNLLKRGKQLQIENVFKELFPQEKFDAKRMHHLNSYLLKVIVQFLTWNEWQQDSMSQHLCLLRSYHKRQLNQAFENFFEQSTQLLKEIPTGNAAYYQYQFLVNFEYYQFAHNSGRSKDVQLQTISDALDTSYCVEKLRIACFQKSHMAFTQTAYETRLLDEVLQYVEEKDLLQIQAVAVYYYAFNALMKPEDEKYFLALKNILELHAAIFPLSDLKDIYLLAINYCIRRINNNDQKYISEVFDLYKFGLNNEVLLQNKTLSRWTYNNIIAAGLRLEEFAWVKNFIFDYKNSLDPIHQEGSFNFNLSKFYFEKGDYKKAMPLLLLMEYDDLLLNLGARTMLMKMYFELEEFDALDTLLMTFKAYLMRKKVYGYHRENYLNIIRFCKKLTRINPYEAKAKSTLQEQIMATEKLTEKKWLLEQLDKL